MGNEEDRQSADHDSEEGRQRGEARRRRRKEGNGRNPGDTQLVASGELLLLLLLTLRPCLICFFPVHFACSETSHLRDPPPVGRLSRYVRRPYLFLLEGRRLKRGVFLVGVTSCRCSLHSVSWASLSQKGIICGRRRRGGRVFVLFPAPSSLISIHWWPSAGMRDLLLLLCFAFSSACARLDFLQMKVFSR